MKASNIAETAERKSLHKSGDPFATCRTRALAREPDGRELRRLLRARRERPCYRAAQQRNEGAAPHVEHRGSSPPFQHGQGREIQASAGRSAAHSACHRWAG
jgi:hypothetical protein